MKTVSLELSKQLKEAGYPQEGEFVYLVDKWGLRDNAFWRLEDLSDSDINHFDASKDCNIFSSPTADEILEIIPIPLKAGANYRPVLSRSPQTGKWEIILIHPTNGNDYKVFKGESLANAAAVMWLYLKKEGLI